MRTVVTHEREWDDWEREKLLGLAEHEASLCACGLPKSVADEDPDLDLKHRVCPVCADLAKAGRIQAAEDEEAMKALGKDPAPEVRRPKDGRHVILRSKTPPEPPI